jgi:hypothetical protein
MLIESLLPGILGSATLILLILYIRDEIESKREHTDLWKIMYILRILTIFTNALYLISRAASFYALSFMIKYEGLCMGVIIFNATMYYLTRICHYAYFSKRAFVIQESVDRKNSSMYFIVVCLGILAVLSGMIKSSTKFPYIENGECYVLEKNTISIVFLGIFVFLDTTLTLYLLKQFVNPIKETFGLDSSESKDADRLRMIKRFEISCYICTVSTIILKLLLIFARYDDYVFIAYIAFSALDSFIHAFAIFYTYENFAKILKKIVFSCKSKKEETQESGHSGLILI